MFHGVYLNVVQRTQFRVSIIGSHCTWEYLLVKFPLSKQRDDLYSSDVTSPDISVQCRLQKLLSNRGSKKSNKVRQLKDNYRVVHC